MRDNLWVEQMGLFTRAEIATIRDRTRRRNYSVEAEEFRREHARHRGWRLTQRHARKLSRLYGSTANAAAVFQRRADELTSPNSSAGAVASTSSEPVGAEPAEPEQAKPEGVAGAARVSGPSGPGNASRCPDPRFRSSRPGKRRPGHPGRHPGPARRTPTAVNSALPPTNRHGISEEPGPKTCGQNAFRQRRTPPFHHARTAPHHRYRETAATISHRDIRRGPPNTPPCPADRAHIGHDRMLRR